MTDKKVSARLFTHWARPSWVRTYEYNFEVGESYYRPLVRYISTTKALSSVSSASSFSSNYNYETRQTRLQRRRRAYSPPGAMSFIERWTNEPFYGYGVGFQPRKSVDRISSLASSSLATTASERRASRSTQIANEFYNSFTSSRSARASSVSERDIRASSVSERNVRAASVARVGSALSRIDESSVAQADSSARYASDDCLMRSTSLAYSNAALASSQEVLNSIERRRAAARAGAIDERELRAKSIELQRHLALYPNQHLVCPPNCPLHNSPEWKRRFLIGNRFLDAAALGGFDVLYDPSVYSNSRRLLSKLYQRSEVDTDEISIERSSALDSSRLRSRCVSVL